MSNNIIASSPNIQGNISNCEIQTVLVNTNYKPFKFNITETYSVINKCDNSIINSYNEGAIGVGATALIIFVPLVILFVCGGILDN